MNIEINDSQNKNNYQIRYSDSFYSIKRIKNKRNEEINDANLYLKIPSKRYSKKVAKSKYYLENAFKRKKTAVEKKEKEEKQAKGESDFHKIKTFNPKNKSQINSQEEYFSPQYKKKSNFGINKNPNDKGALNIITLTNKIYEDEEHFQKNIINKKNYKNISPNPRVKRNNILSERINDLFPNKKKLSFGINYKFFKDLLPENSNKNIHLRKRLSSSIKIGEINLFNRSIEKSNYSNFLKIKQNLRNIIKERENSKFFFETQKNNNKYKLNNDNQNGLLRAKTFKQIRNKDNKYYEKFDEKKDKTTVKSNRKIKLNKMNTQKINVQKMNINKNQIQDVDLNQKEIIKKQNNSKKNRKSWCVLCCLNNDPNDSDNEN